MSSTVVPPLSRSSTRGNGSAAPMSAAWENVRSTNGRVIGRSTANRWSLARRTVEPRGGITSSPRVIMAMTVSSGSAMRDRRRPTARESRPSVYSTMSALTLPSEVISSVAAGWAGGASARPSRRATVASVEPCRIAEISTTKNTALKITGAPGSSNSNGKIASTMGTEPRRPTQDTRVVSRLLKPKSSITGTTASGRATNISTSAISSPWIQTSSSAIGSISRPSTTNMVIWASQAMPSWNRKTLRLNAKWLLPTTVPAMKIARKPLPPRLAAKPNASRPQAVTSTGYMPDACSRMRLSRPTAPQPTPSPTAAPMPICIRNSLSSPRPSGTSLAMTWMRPMVRKIAIGSLDALSTSNSAFSRLRMWMLALRNCANTAAASVDPTMAPISRPFISGQSRIFAAARPVTTAVTSTPSVASTEAGFHTDRIDATGVCRPPS